MIWGFRLVYGIQNLSGVRSMVSLAAEFALSFPLAAIWFGILHIRISLQFDIESSLLTFLFPNDNKRQSVNLRI